MTVSIIFLFKHYGILFHMIIRIKVTKSPLNLTIVIVFVGMFVYVCDCVYMCMCVRVCVRACVRACDGQLNNTLQIKYNTTTNATP